LVASSTRARKSAETGTSRLAFAGSTGSRCEYVRPPLARRI
jgi:hypothetical protein